MADLTVSGATGEGRSAFSDWRPVLYLTVNVTSLPNSSRIFGSMAPRGFWSVGMVGLGNWDDDGSDVSPSQITFSEFIHFETQAFFIPTWAIGTPYFHSVFWRLKAGVVIDLDVQWTPP